MNSEERVESLSVEGRDGLHGRQHRMEKES
jgi:hypothetical protein